MKYSTYFLVLVCSTIFGGGCYQFELEREAIEIGNWRVHPQIQEIDQIYGQIENATSLKQEESHPQTEALGQAWRSVKVIQIKDDDKVRVKIINLVNEENRIVISRYADFSEVPRFVLIAHKKKSGSELYWRIYLNEKREPIWHIQEVGHPFDSVEKDILDWRSTIDSDIDTELIENYPFLKLDQYLTVLSDDVA